MIDDSLSRGVKQPPCVQCGKGIETGAPRVSLVNTIRFVSSSGDGRLMCDNTVRLDKSKHSPDAKLWQLSWHPECFGPWMIDRIHHMPSVHHHEKEYFAKP